MTTPATEAGRLLLEGIRAAFATSGGNPQTPERIVDFLSVSYLPLIEAEASAGDRERALEALYEFCLNLLSKHEVRDPQATALLVDWNDLVTLRNAMSALAQQQGPGEREEGA